MPREKIIYCCQPQSFTCIIKQMKYFAMQHFKHLKTFAIEFNLGNDNLQKHWLYLCSAKILKRFTQDYISTDVFNPLLTWKQIPRAILQRTFCLQTQWKQIPCNLSKSSKQCLIIGFPQIPQVEEREQTSLKGSNFPEQHLKVSTDNLVMKYSTTSKVDISNYNFFKQQLQMLGYSTSMLNQ